MRVQSLDKHSTATLEEHNAANHPDKAQRQFWQAHAPTSDKLRRCHLLPETLSAFVQGLSDLRSCTCLGCSERAMSLGTRRCPAIAAVGTFFQPHHSHADAVSAIYLHGYTLAARPDPADKPQAVLIPAQQAVVPLEMSNRFDMIIWVDALAMLAAMPVTLRQDGAWVTGGATSGLGFAIIPRHFIIAVEPARDRAALT
jgi:hypothetical protein